MRQDTAADQEHRRRPADGQGPHQIRRPRQDRAAEPPLPPVRGSREIKADIVQPHDAGEEIIDATHWLGALITSSGLIGTLGTTPVRAVIDAAAALIPTERWCLAMVVAPGTDGLETCVAGRPEVAWAAADALLASWLAPGQSPGRDERLRANTRVLARSHLDDLWHERQRPDRSGAGRLSEGAAMASCLDPLRDDRIGAGRFELPRFGDSSGGAQDDAAGSLDLMHGLAGWQAKMKANHLRAQLADEFEPLLIEG